VHILGNELQVNLGPKLGMAPDLLWRASCLLPWVGVPPVNVRDFRPLCFKKERKKDLEWKVGSEGRVQKKSRDFVLPIDFWIFTSF
jgi:hypothetical protein